MCGIGGIVGRKISEVEIDLMIKSLEHRGPDGNGFIAGDWGFICHTRLSILDLSNNGLQPFSKFNGTIISAHNGEIYNYQELKNRLSNTSEFISSSDSELIPFYYREFGIEESVINYEGMFAISILDLDQNKLYLVRDQYGIKPLYYYVDEESIIFGSEIKSILSNIEESKKEICNQSVYDFFSLGYIVEPDTFYKNIKAVPAGNILVYDLVSKKIELTDYCKGRLRNAPIEKDGVSEFDLLFKKVVEQQCITDVPMGSFLSGGVDSSLISSYYSKIVKNPQTFTVSFDSKDRDESEIALKTATDLHTNHTTISTKKLKNFDQLDKLIQHFDQPFGDLSMLSTYLLTNEVSKHVKVVLSGDGGDEFIAGYPKFKQLWVISNFPKIFRNLSKYGIFKIFLKENQRNKLNGLLNKNFEEQMFQLSSYLLDTDLRLFFNQKYISPSRYFTYNTDCTLIQNVTINQVKTSLVSKMLPKVDRMSMLNAIEVRVPLLDSVLTSKIFQLRDKLKLNICNSKILYRKLLKIVLPNYRNNKKRGFDFGISELEKLGYINKWISEVLEVDVTARIWQVISREKAVEWIEGYKNSNNTRYSKLSQVQIIFHLYVLGKWIN